MNKRLRYYVGKITDQKTTTYRYSVVVDGKPVQKEIYDGECIEYTVKPNGEIDGSGDRVQVRREPTFWHNGIAYTFDRTGKQALDRPTVTICIPVEMPGITEFTPAAADFCLRTFATFYEGYNADYFNRTRPDRENGRFILHAPSPKVLVRNTAYFAAIPAMDYTEGKNNIIYFCPYVDLPADIFCLCIRMEIQLPYLKLDRAKTMLLKQLPEGAERFVKAFDNHGLSAAVQLERVQAEIRMFLRDTGYCAFIANGSILVRGKGDSPSKNAVPFEAPAAHEIEAAGIRGLGIKRGVTVITGGGYSGKSTILNAISAGIYNHIAGDGRELCITDDSAVTITAEDGRAVSRVDISPFLQWIPNGDPHDFSTAHASGATSQAANIMEAVNCGARLLLLDEDRSATNFMIRDATMKRLIEKEPITPFTDRVNALAEMGTSTILVIGGSGEYLSVADTVYMMDEYVMHDATQKAKFLVLPFTPPNPHKQWKSERKISQLFSPYPTGATREKLDVSDTNFIIIGDERIDIRSLHDLATPQQANALAFILRHLANQEDGTDSLEKMALALRGLTPKTNPSAQANGQGINILEKIDVLYTEIENRGLNHVDTGFFTNMQRFMELPRPIEILFAANRMRHVLWQR
ncbi:MAG: ABC-ATPase domain-containing protein [Defluviitaleaceae bacterium]|nr:ABC-ATPase domain-containing protein [Defluviitaleaceae bacterium]MCL2274261.1 ABC-ATPase domain-containing protein [Defluviitaleaceae bacterium]